MSEESPSFDNQLGRLFRSQRTRRYLSQEDLAQVAGVSVDSVQRIESASYRLPVRSSKSGHAISLLAGTLEIDLCAAILDSFSREEIIKSAFSYCLPPTTDAKTNAPASQSDSLADQFEGLPSDPAELIAAAAMLNADAMTYLMKLERTFDKFEFLVTNQPPFSLFADYEYVTTGNSAVALSARNRAQFHQLIFDHNDYMRLLVRSGKKHVKVVLHFDSLISFLNSRSAARARDIVNSMIEYLQFDGFDLVLLEQSDPPEEYEILSTSYPINLTKASTCISVQHRRIGLGQTEQYVLSLNGAILDLVAEDHRRADALWRRGLETVEAMDEEALTPSPNLVLKRKRVAAYKLREALQAAHSETRPQV